MSEQETVQPEQGAKVEANAEAEVSIEQLMEEVGRLKQTNERILSESKDWKAKYQGIRGEVEQKEKHELESKEQWKELLEKERNEKFEIQDQLKGMRKKILGKSLKFELAKNAADAEDIDLLAQALPESMVEINEENLTIGGIKDAVDHLRKEKPFLFKKQSAPKMVNERPQAFENKPSLGQMTASERDQQMKSALAQLIN